MYHPRYAFPAKLISHFLIMAIVSVFLNTTIPVLTDVFYVQLDACSAHRVLLAQLATQSTISPWFLMFANAIPAYF